MNPTLIKNVKAGAAVVKHRIVKFGADDDHMVQGAAATDLLMAVADELGASAAEKRLDVVVAGIADVEYGGTVTRGDPLTSDAVGKAIKSTRHTHTENTNATYVQNATTGVGTAERIIGHAYVSAVAGDIGPMLISPGLA